MISNPAKVAVNEIQFCVKSLLLDFDILDVKLKSEMPVNRRSERGNSELKPPSEALCAFRWRSGVSIDRTLLFL